MTTCAADDCEKTVKTRGMCSTHYERVRLTGDINRGRRRHASPTCSIKDCDKATKARGWCGLSHLTYWFERLRLTRGRTIGPTCLPNICDTFLLHGVRPHRP